MRKAAILLPLLDVVHDALTTLTCPRCADYGHLVGYQPFLTLIDSNAGYARARIQTGNGDLGFFTNSFVGGNAPMVIKNNSGNVGIGTINPAAKLDVSGTTRTGVLQITGGSDLSEQFDIQAAPNRGGLDGQVQPGMG